MQENTFRGWTLDAQGRKLQVKTYLDTTTLRQGSLADSRFLGFDARGDVVYLTIDDILAEVPAAETTTTTGDGTVFDILSGNAILTVSQPDLSAADVTLTVDETAIDHDALTNFVANEHIDHTSVTLTAGVGLAGGGDISANRTFDLDITELTEDTSPDEAADFLVTYDTSAGAHKKVKPSNIQPVVTNATGTLPITAGGTGQTTQTAAFDALDPLTTKGDIIVHDGTNSVRRAVGTNGYVLTADSGETTGVKWAPAGGGTAAWTTVIKTTNQDVTGDNTLNDDADLQFAVAADTNYVVRGMIFFFSASATPDIQWDISCSGTVTDALQTSWKLDDGATALANVLGDATIGGGGNTIAMAANELNILWVHLFLRVGASGGTVIFRWAQDTSDGTATTVYAGSFIEYISKAP